MSPSEIKQVHTIVGGHFLNFASSLRQRSSSNHNGKFCDEALIDVARCAEDIARACGLNVPFRDPSIIDDAWNH